MAYSVQPVRNLTFTSPTRAPVPRSTTPFNYNSGMAGLTTQSTPTGVNGLNYQSGPGYSGTPQFGSYPADAAAAAAAPAPDPYAAWGGQAGYNQAVSDYGASSAQTNASINERIGSEGTKYGSGILDFIDQNRIGQNSINAKTVQNELSKQQGSAGVLETVGRGVRSGGVMLANKNASNSSAAEALARAWGDFGRREQTGVNNQFVNGQNSINNAQVEFGIQQAQGSRRLGEGKAQVINSIVGDAQTALSALNAQAASASLPDRVNIEQRKAEIRNQTLQALQQYDNQLTQGLSGIKQIDPNAARTQATSMRTAGVAATNPFNYTTDVPQSVQNTGPFASELPIFQYSGARKTEGL